MDIPKWILAAFVGAAPMLGMVFFILFSCTLLGLVQRCKINLTKSYAKRRRLRQTEQASIDGGNLAMDALLKPPTGTVIISPFDDIPMKDIDADTTSKGYSEPKDGKHLSLSDIPSVIYLSDISHSSTFQRNRSRENSQADSDYDNGSSSIFNDNDYEQDRLSLLETASQRRLAIKQSKTPETIINI